MNRTENANHPFNRWLIVRQGAIGDTILLSPLIQTIRSAVPHAWIELMGVRERVGLLVGDGLADSAVSLERPGMERLYVDHAPLPRDLMDYFGSFDVILFFSGSNRPSLQNQLQVKPETTVRVYPALPPPGYSQHSSDHYRAILKGLIDVASPPVPRIVLQSTEIEEADRYFDTLGIDRKRAFLLAMHVGAGSAAKRAPLDIFVQIANSIHPPVPIVCLVPQGPADSEAVSQFRSRMKNHRIHILQELPLRHLAAILSLSHAAVGNDSGIIHMAAAVGCPTLALFTSSDPVVWHPLGYRSRALVLSEGYLDRLR